MLDVENVAVLKDGMRYLTGGIGRLLICLVFAPRQLQVIQTERQERLWLRSVSTRKSRCLGQANAIESRVVKPLKGLLSLHFGR
jgi:hypothetical protein